MAKGARIAAGSTDLRVVQATEREGYIDLVFAGFPLGTSFSVRKDSFLDTGRVQDGDMVRVDFIVKEL